MGCCLGLLMCLLLIVLGGLAHWYEEAQLQLALGGHRLDESFYAGQTVSIELPDDLLDGLAARYTTRVSSARHGAGRFKIELDPVSLEPGSPEAELRFTVTIDGITPRVEGFAGQGQVLWAHRYEPGTIMPVPEGVLITCPCLDEEHQQGIVSLRFFGR